MKKRIVIGDPHGRWEFVKQIYDKEQPDKVIILGDYFDSFKIDAYAQRECYDHIIELRNEHINKGKGDFIMLFKERNTLIHFLDILSYCA